MRPSRQAIQGLSEKVRALLFEEWDPIGFGPSLPRDEYDCAVDRVVGLVGRGAGAEEIAVFLSQEAREHFGCPLPETVHTAVAQKLAALRSEKA